MQTALRFIRQMATATSTQGRHFIAVCQLTSGHDLDKNFEVCQDLVQKAKAKNAEVRGMLLVVIV